MCFQDLRAELDYDCVLQIRPQGEDSGMCFAALYVSLATRLTIYNAIDTMSAEEGSSWSVAKRDRAKEGS